MKILIDTNVWLDIILGREEFHDSSLTVLYECIDADEEMCVTATALKDIFYITERIEGAEEAYRSVEYLLESATVVAVDGAVCRKALSLERPDYEDGIVAGCALAESVDCIITRDEAAFTGLGIKRFTPVEFMKARGWEVIAF